MKHRLKFYKEQKFGLTSLPNSYLEHVNITEECDSNYQSAKEVLMSIPDEHYVERLNNIDIRTANNGSDITRWNQHRLKTCNKENQVKFKKSAKKCRHVSSENSYVENQHSHFSIGYSLKKELNKLQLPLKEKNINQDQFRESQRQKERNKTRNEIKLDIINSKFELTPVAPSRKKTNPEHNCENIVKLKTQNNHYQRIRRRGLFTIDLQQQLVQQEIILKTMNKTKEKAFFLKNQYDNCSKLRERSANHIFANFQ